jgi:hypothetical protein
MPRIYTAPVRPQTDAQIAAQKANGLRRRAGRRGAALRSARAYDAVREVAAEACGVGYQPVGLIGKARDWDYVYPTPPRPDEVGTAYGRHALTVQRDETTGFYEIVPVTGG